LSMHITILATMLGSLDCTEITKYSSWKNVNNQVVREALVLSGTHIGKSASAHKLVQGLKPDLLGVWFVLASFAGYVEVEQIMQTAWRIAPKKMAAFLQRCAQDFPMHPETERILAIRPLCFNAQSVYVENTTSLIVTLLESGFQKKLPENVTLSLIEAAEQNAVAGAMLGYFHLSGILFPYDEELAFNYFTKAANLKNKNAMYNMGVLKKQGIGCDVDPNEAVEWWLKAEAEGDTASMYNLAMCHRDGSGVEKSSKSYWTWLSKAADFGDREAMATIGYHYEFGVGVEPDEGKAWDWYVKSWIRSEEDEYPDVNIYSPMHMAAASHH